MGSISHYITPLVINSLGGGHTHTHTHTSILSRTEAIIRNQARVGLRPAHVWFNKFTCLLIIPRNINACTNVDDINLDCNEVFGNIQYPYKIND